MLTEVNANTRGDREYRTDSKYAWGREAKRFWEGGITQFEKLNVFAQKKKIHSLILNKNKA